jgi:hypothetical protein
MSDMRVIQNFWRQPLFWAVAGALAVGLVVGGILWLVHPRLPISSEIRKQLTFPLFYPGTESSYVVDAKTVNYNGHDKVLIFHAKSGDTDMTISEQATPDPFNDIPEYYPKLIEKLHGYNDFDSLNGKVSLTRPEELKGGQSAVFNGKGTLMFVHPSRDLRDDEWRSFFNALIIGK